ncbi:hypothetical protein TNCT_541911 [Trichonephila clavata]|uniref:Uncharacterized protein n=1 Tax=Trichonephila clavata TaxID=2740835 RepID=A0A8X6L894_TRICU|nr:hypothetical protein TNCT_541911 [Trichonephila clavata]
MECHTNSLQLDSCMTNKSSHGLRADSSSLKILDNPLDYCRRSLQSIADLPFPPHQVPSYEMCAVKRTFEADVFRAKIVATHKADPLNHK